MNDTVKRLYLQDTQHGDIYAVAVDTYETKPIIVGVKRCTRAEELVAGALPVMPLETTEVDLQAVQALYNERVLFPWVPPEAPSPTMHKLIELREQLGKAQAKTKAAKERLKTVQGEESEIETQIFAILATLHEPQAALPFEAPADPAVFTPDPNAVATPEPAPAVPPVDPLFADDAAFVEGEGKLGGDHAIADGEPIVDEGDDVPLDAPVENPGPDPMDTAERERDLDEYVPRD